MRVVGRSAMHSGAVTRTACDGCAQFKIRKQERTVQKFIAGLSLSWLIAGTPALAEPPRIVATVDSPGKILHVELSLDEGRISYTISRFGNPVIAPSRLGFLLRDTEKLERNFALASQSTRSVDETWEQPWGETRFVRNHYTELSARFTEQVKLKRSLDVVFRVYDDGVGFRYAFPDQAQLKDVIIETS